MEAPRSVLLSSPYFTDGGVIPEKYARKPPGICWMKLPPGVRELALVVDDPDAPSAEPYVHYVLTRISPEGGGPRPVVGLSESGKAVWEPLEPPAGETHRYRFRFYALGISLPDSPFSKAGLLEATRGHVLAWGELMGRYGGKP